MAKKSDMVDDIAHKLHTWSMKEMQFHPQGQYINSKLPVYEDFKDICRGPMAEIWKFVTDNVYSVQTVKKVKGNLALKGKQTHNKYSVQFQSGSQFNEEKEKLFEERTQLSGQLTNTISDVSHLENDLKRLERDILKTESEYRKAVDNIEDLEKKSSLLEIYSQQCQETVLNYDHFTEKLHAKTKAITQKTQVDVSGEPLFITKSSDQPDKRLETVCGKNVRESCEKFEEFLHDTFKGNFSSDKTVFQSRKDHLWSEVEKVLSEFLTIQIVNGLIVNTQDSSLNVRDKTNKINIRKDAENLRFQYGKGELTDVSLPSSSLHSVRQLLEQSQLLHVKRFMEAEKHKNQAWRGGQRLDEIKKAIDKLLVQRFEQRPGELKLARTLVETNLQLSADRAGLHSLLAECEQLREAINKGVQEREVLQSKFFKIKTFKELTEQKQNLIRGLVKQNLNAQSRLETQKIENTNYIEKSLSSHYTTTVAVSNSLKSRVQQEIDKLSSLSLPYLMFLHLDNGTRVSALDLSINHFHHPECMSVRRSLQELLQLLHFKPYKAPECLLIWCEKLKSDINHYNHLVESQDSASQRVYGPHKDKIDTIENITDLCQQVSEHDKEQSEKLLPALQKSISTSKAGLAECSQIKEDIQAWIEQPAQFTTPWVIQNGQTYKEWLEKWTVLCTRLRKIQLQQRDGK
ncbi:hypothetical protein LOTGIDRAFT_228691 [Lottia gigantea]|uniref:HAUS augmin-like complex subunit 5 n=1 Tax=Lottia gigantea TaxID=225164 RepID=V4AKH0_LOTGI|nr:hypothetical protein LOTGIDRAFT_228691 [Lottia gigantea]ESO94051.1 hypothetical protein LOTGIDRAFT_228691 [Lottia gigantea]